MLREPDGSTFVFNRGIQTRQRQAETSYALTRLGIREPVTRHDDDLACIAEQHRDVLGVGRTHRPIAHLLRTR